MFGQLAGWLAGLFSPRSIEPGAYRAPRDLAPLADDEQRIVDDFHRLYYRLWKSKRGTIDTSWMGYRALKCPLDLWIYQEIICETEPDVIIECGTRFGGSGLYLASICQLLGRGRVVSVDIDDQPERPQHQRLTYIHGSSVDPSTVQAVRRSLRGSRNVMVILDSDHTKDHVLKELETYAEVVTPGCYLVVEDTNINGHPAYEDFGPGPMEAVEEFLPGRDDFVVDRDCERFLMTLNPKGFLRKIGPGQAT